MASLAGSDYKNLESLDAQGKLIGDEKTNFDNLRKLKEELDAVGISAEDLQKQLGELLTGTSTSGLADGLKSLFENGKRSAQDFGDSFEEIMRNSLMNTFKAKYLDDALQPFFEELATMMESGTPTDEQIAALKAKYVKIGEDADAYLKNVEEITGQKLGKDDPSALKPNSLTASMNQPTAERLEGLWRGQYDLTDQIKSISLEMLDIDRRQLALSEKFGLGFQDQTDIMNNVLFHIANIDTNTLRSANNTDRLQSIEKTLTSIDNKTGAKTTRD